MSFCVGRELAGVFLTSDEKTPSDKLADSSASDGVVIQWVIREVSGGSSYPVLTKTNYSD